MMLLTDTRIKPVNDSVLEPVAVLRDRVIARSIAERKEQDALTLAMRTAHRNGASVDALSNASGLPPKEVERRLQDCPVDTELQALAGIIV